MLLDPLLGIGSSAIAAKKLNIQTCIGFEIDEEYLQIAKDRIESTDSENFQYDVADSSSPSDPELPL